jgi:hypothetical protein
MNKNSFCNLGQKIASDSEPPPWRKKHMREGAPDFLNSPAKSGQTAWACLRTPTPWFRRNH